MRTADVLVSNGWYLPRPHVGVAWDPFSLYPNLRLLILILQYIVLLVVALYKIVPILSDV
jgi:hypothetical protein